MNKKQELRLKAIKEFDEANAVIESIPDNVQEHVDFISSGFDVGTVFFKPSSYEDMMSILHGNKYGMKKYYMNTGQLAVKYEITDRVQWVFFLPPECVDIISKGKCSIKKQTRTESVVVCDL